MNRQGVSLGRIIGIPISLDYSWFLIFALITTTLAVGYYPAEFKDWPVLQYWVMGALTALLFFGSILLHELGHAVVALAYKIPVRRITLFLFGGVAQIGAEPPSARSEFLIAIAGPIVSLILGFLFLGAEFLFANIPPLLALAKYLSFINFAVVVFNMIPGFPLDGGRVFRAIIWAITKNFRRATTIAANVGRFIGLLFIFLGVWRMFSGDLGGGIWMALIGWFLDSAASSQLQQVVFQSLLSGHTVGQVMSGHPTTVPVEITLQQLVDGHVLGGGERYFLVRGGDSIVGLMTLLAIREIPRDRWHSATAADAMIPLAKLKKITPETNLWKALQHMDRTGVNQIPVVAHDRVVGMLTREDVITYLVTMQELGL